MELHPFEWRDSNKQLPAAETGIPISHNSVASAVADHLADSSICLLALDIGSPAQLSVTPVTKVGNSFWCVLQPVLDVKHKLICAGHLCCWGIQQSSFEGWLSVQPQLRLAQPVLDTAGLLPPAAAP